MSKRAIQAKEAQRACQGVRRRPAGRRPAL